MSAKKRILVVDDEPDFCAIVQTNLEKEGFEVELAYNGVEGLEKVQANPPDATHQIGSGPPKKSPGSRPGAFHFPECLSGTTYSLIPTRSRKNA